MGSIGVEPIPADFQSAASTELAYFPNTPVARSDMPISSVFVAYGEFTV